MAKAKMQPTQALALKKEEQLYGTPQNWIWIKLRTACDLINGDRGVNYPSKKDYIEVGIPFINAGAIQDGDLDASAFNYISQEKYEALRSGKTSANDILYCLRGSLGKVAIVSFSTPAAISSSLCILRPKSILNVKHLFYLLNSEVILRQQELEENGSAQPNLSAASVLNYKFPLPPLPEQHRIVDRIESLFAKLDEAKEKAQAVVDGFEDRKAAILHKAFTGELTAEWRKEKGNPVWVEGTLGEYLFPMETRKPEGTEFLYIDIDSIDNKIQKVKEPKLIKTSKAPSRANRAVHQGDTVFSMVRPYLRNIAFIDEQLSSCIASTGFYVCSPKASLYPRYLFYLLCSKDAIDYLMQYMKGDNSPSIRNDDLLNMPVTLPLIDEQILIVQIIQNTISQEQRAKETAAQVISQIDTMKKAILARAFRGELGTNDPSEPPVDIGIE